MVRNQRWTRRAAAVGAVLVLSFFTTACFDRQELEQQAFVTTLGVDKAPGGMVDCTFRIALPVNTAGGGSANTGKTPLSGVTPVTYRARSITEAMTLANTSIERVLTFTHLTAIVFGEDLAREGLHAHLQPLVRYREFRRTVFPVVSKGKARDFLLNDEPMLERSPTRVADAVVQMGTSSGLIPGDRLHDFLTALENPHEDPVMSCVAVNSRVEEDPKGKNGVQGRGADFTAGEVGRAGGNPAEWSGTALFHGDRLVGFLNGRETIELQLMRGRVRKTKLEFQDPRDASKTVGIILRRERSPQYTIQPGHPLKIMVKIPLDADLASTESDIDYTQPTNRQYLERQLSVMMSREMEALLGKIVHQYHADVLPIARAARRKFSTYQQFEQYPWERELGQAQLVVQTDLHIRRFGVLFGPTKRDDGGANSVRSTGIPSSQ